MSHIRLIKNEYIGAKADISEFSEAQAAKTRRFHESIPGYEPTPLVSLPSLADRLGVCGIFIKDESKRFNLNAFKVLGGSYAIGNLISAKLGEDISNLPFEQMTSDKVRRKLGDITFITATDGNHGRGIAWTADRLGQHSIVYMPKGTAKERLDNIRALGAAADITDLTYDEAVRKAGKDAEENGWILVQDTSLPGYEEIPKLIMQGYLTMISEAIQQLGPVIPTHVFLQAGVGSMAAAATAFLAGYYGRNKPVITVVEPHSADCVFRTAEANDGFLHAVDGEMSTMMAGLACGEPCRPAWEILQSYADFFGTMDDCAAAEAMRVLACPPKEDTGVVSGESGAAGLGFALEILQSEEHAKEREMLRLDENAVILCFSTEGATDVTNYNKVVFGK